MVGNAADKVQVKKARKKEKEASEQELNDLRYLVNTGEGSRFLWTLMAHCRTFESTFHPDPNQHAFNAGVRDVGNFVLTRLMEADGEAFVRMIEANRKERE